jgi:4-hydroxy-tetrahydrodipicolinate synthase
VSSTRDVPIPGVTSALVTLFDDGLAVDYAATAALAGRLGEQGIGAVLVAGTTGEGALLDGDERSRLIEAVRAALPADVPVAAGVFAERGEEAALDARRALEAGADGVISLSSPIEEPERFYAAVAAASDGGFALAYHLPPERPLRLGVEDAASLPVDGLKDASGDANRMLRHLSATPMPLYVGAGLLGLARAAGCAGAVLALANVDPVLCLDVWAGELDRLPDLARLHVEASTDFPAGLKRLLGARLGTSTTVRRR